LISIPTITTTGPRLTTTQKTWKAIWVVKDSMVEFQAVPKLEPPIDPNEEEQYWW
jgi:hypothetical protein